MFTSANMLELQRLLAAVHADPHHILGMHKIEDEQNTPALIVRVFNPHAESVTVLDPSNSSASWALEKIHVDGFFEGIITGREDWFPYTLQTTDAQGHSFTSRDPYSFSPVISDLDCFLFGEGTHYRIYEKLGAHPMRLDSTDGVLFAVWAPNAQRVSVIGHFNNWDGRRHMMRMIDHSGIWELFIPGLQTYDHYQFEIKTPQDTVIRKTDPFGSFFELRPGKDSLVYDISQYKWNDSKWLAKRKTTDPLTQPMNIYELHLGSWQHGEDGRFLSYAETADRLIPYIKDMGYTHIELLPVEEHPFDGSWGYQVTGYFAPTSRYGTPDEFMTFIDKLHQNDIGVILDWVPAHFPKDAHGLARFDGTALFEHEDPRRGEHPEWGTLVFNYGRREVKNFLIASAIFWIEQYHLDGLRVDAVASMLYLDYAKKDGEWIPNEYGGNHNLDAVEFIKHMNSVILGAHPHVMMIAEESTSWKGVSRPTAQGGLGFSLKWNMGWMNDFLAYVAKDPIYRRYAHNNLTFGMMYAYTENFVLVLSHDEVVHGKKSMLDKMPGDLWRKFANLRVALGFMYGHPGKKLLYMGSEFGQFIEWDEKRELDWFLLEYDHHKQMQDFTRDLNHLYKEERAFWYDDFNGQGFEWIDCNDASRSLVVFLRKTDKPGETLYIACNFTPNPIENYPIGVNEKGTYTELLNSDDPKYGGSGLVNAGALTAVADNPFGRAYSVTVTLPPLGCLVLRKTNAKKPTK